MALRGGRRDSLRGPIWVSVENRGRSTSSALGSSARTTGSSVAEPSSIVSSRPRAFSSRSVKMCPRSRSAPSCASSSATNAVPPPSRGIASAVHRKYRAFAGSIRSSPVMSAVCSRPLIATTRSYTSRASRRSGNPIVPLEWAHMRSIARWVLPVLVGPRTAFSWAFVTPTKWHCARPMPSARLSERSYRRAKASH